MDGKRGEGADKVAVLQGFQGSVVIIRNTYVSMAPKSDDNSPVSIFFKTVTMCVNPCQRNGMAKTKI